MCIKQLYIYIYIYIYIYVCMPFRNLAKTLKQDCLGDLKRCDLRYAETGSLIISTISHLNAISRPLAHSAVS